MFEMATMNLSVMIADDELWLRMIYDENFSAI